MAGGLAWLNKLAKLLPAERLERGMYVAERLPQLREVYSPQAVARAVEYASPGQLIPLTPRQYGKLAEPLDLMQADPYVRHYADLIRNKKWTEPEKGLFKKGYLEEMRSTPYEGFSDLPFLGFDKRDAGLRVSSHEGRHRNLAKGEVFGWDTPFLTRISETSVTKPLPEGLRFTIAPQDGDARFLLPDVTIEIPERYAQGGLACLHR